MLHRNLPLKAASALLAIFLWFWVTLNEENRIAQKTVDVPILALGVQAGLALRLGTQTVKVTLRGLEQDMSDLRSEVHATVSCAGLRADTHQLAVKVAAPENLAVIAVRPASVPVLLEKTVSQARPVELKLVGEPIGGVDVRSADFSPMQVRIAGARSRVERTAHVVVTADPARLAPGVPVSIAVHALDSSGAPVEGIAITPRRITVTAVAAPSPPRQTKEQPSA